MDENFSLNTIKLLSTGCKLIAVYFILRFFFNLPNIVTMFLRPSGANPEFSILTYTVIWAGTRLLPFLLFFGADWLATSVVESSQVSLIKTENFSEDLVYPGLLLLGVGFIITGTSDLAGAYVQWDISSTNPFEHGLHHFLNPLLRLLFGSGLVIFGGSLSQFFIEIKDDGINLSRLNQEKYIPFITLGIVLVVFIVVYLLG